MKILNLCRRQLTPSQSKRSHLSVRGGLHDRQDLVHVVVRQQSVVSMHTSDFQLNASEILTAANVRDSKRKPWVSILRQHTTVVKDENGRTLWVPFRDGIFLCQAFGFEDDLKSWFSQFDLSPPERAENYLLRYLLASQTPQQRLGVERFGGGYEAILHDNHRIAYLAV